ncbi:MAG: hypothetical protein KKC03_04975 [Bacteroidetes bacterium]|nr:hypothetical protein [Bacteroidota bacterium]
MNSTIYKIFEYGYLGIAAFFLFNTFSIWNENRQKAYLYLFFVVLALLLYLFKRNFRKKFERQNKPDQ